MESEKLVYDLNGSWVMKRLPEREEISVTVPGSVLNDLIINGKIEDPFWRENENMARDLFYNDYSYYREFEISEAMLNYDNLELVCYGIDTLSEIYINGSLLAKTDNMHRTWRLNVLEKLTPGTNSIEVILRSPLKFIEEKHRNSTITNTAGGSIHGNNYIRKAHSMFGWDWGPQLPDAGIWRDIQIEGYNVAKFDDVYITQKHTDNRVDLNIKVTVKNFSRTQISALKAVYTLVSPDGSELSGSCSFDKFSSEINISVENPKLWWPNGYGEHPLYNLKLQLLSESKLLDTYTARIGLRTLTVSQEPDEWGSEFAFMVNGIKIFSMGADYILQDNVLPRVTKEKIDKLIDSCLRANFNCLRVWGGGYFPNDYFYDLCDEVGIILWQDLLFACNIYELTEEFEESITRETEDNVKRLRHHACLGLWCGNNEMEYFWVESEEVRNHGPKLMTDYVKQFEYVLPKITKKTDPNTFYWVSSPSSGGGFDNPNDGNRGDVHEWSVWHGLQPFTAYRNMYYRFSSEFGFGAFPNIKTIKAYTAEEDRNVFSKVMDAHQKCYAGNAKIAYYIADNYKYPKDFDSVVYVSQLLQLQAIRCGVEHWRRNRGRCMGATYWQLNDCWPTASWASIDYFGRWKALHYGAKRFFSPLLASVEDKDTDIKIFAHNESMNDRNGKLLIKLKDKSFNICFEETLDIKIPALSAGEAFHKDFSEFFKDEALKSEMFLEYTLLVDGMAVSTGSHIFTKPKYFNFDKAAYRVSITDFNDKFVIKVNTDTYTSFVELDFDDIDCIFSDNYFDITDAHGVTVYLNKKDTSVPVSAELLEKSIKIRSVADTL